MPVFGLIEAALINVFQITKCRELNSKQPIVGENRPLSSLPEGETPYVLPGVWVKGKKGGFGGSGLLESGRESRHSESD